MKLRLKLMFYILVLFGTVGQIIAQNDQIKIKKTFEELKIFAPESRLILEETDKMTSYPDGRIVFGLKRYRYYRKLIPDEMEPYLISFFLAHEIAHQLQFMQKEQYKMNSLSLLDRMILEGQADVLAGSLLGFYLMRDRFALSSDSRRILKTRDTDCAVEILYFSRLISEFGIQEGSQVGTHPTRENRVKLFKEGFTFGLINLVAVAIHKDENLRNDPQRKKYVSDSQEAIDFSEEEGIMRWSEKVSKRVNNYHPDIANNIILLQKKSVITLDTTTFKTPHFKYSLYYKNISEDPIIADFEMYSMYHKKDSLELVEYHSKIDSKYIEFEIQPQEVKHIQGFVAAKLKEECGYRFNFCKDKFIKVAVPYVHDTQANFSFRFSKPGKEKEFLNSDTYFSFAPNKDQSTVKNSLLSFIRSIKYNPKSLTMGVGNSQLSPDDPLDEEDFYTFASRIEFGKGFKTTIYLNTNTNSKRNFIIIKNENVQEIPIEKIKTKKLLDSFDEALTDYKREVFFEDHLFKFITYTKDSFTVSLQMVNQSKTAEKSWSIYTITIGPSNLK